MSRFVLSPEAASDLADIWVYIRDRSSEDTADNVERTIRSKFVALAKSPRIGHRRKDLTDESVLFFPVYSFLIVYRPDSKPLQIVAILHGYRELKSVLRDRI